jgi:flagellar motor switch protein FliM
MIRKDMNTLTDVRDIKVSDFKKEEGFPLEVKRKLDEVHHRFAQDLTAFFNRSGIEEMEVTFVRSQYLKPEGQTAEGFEKKFHFVLELDRNQKGALEIDKNTVIHMLTCLLGYADEGKISFNRLTKIEQITLNQLVCDMLRELQSSWRDDLKIGNSLDDFEKEVLAQNELILSEFSLTIGETTGDISVFYPLSAINSALLKNLNQEEEQEKIKLFLEDSELDLVYTLGRASLTPDQLLELKPEDIIVLEGESNTEGELLVQSQGKFKGIAGVFKNRKAVKITSAIF